MPKREIFDDVCLLLSEVIKPDGGLSKEKAYLGWNPDHWEDVIELASCSFVLPAIASRFRQDESLQSANPSLHQFFETLHAGNLARNREILAQIETMALLANQCGIEPILLKGSAYLIIESYGDPGARYQSDIDILVSESERDILVQKLKEEGYHQDDEGKDFSEFYHAAPLFAKDSDIAIEIHSDTGEYWFGLRPGGRKLDLDFAGISKRAVAKTLGRATLRVPSLQDLLVHALSHNQLGHGQRFNGFIEMRDLLDLHFLTRNGEESAWACAMQTFERTGYGSLIRGFLRALETSVPGFALPQAGTGTGLVVRFHSWRYRLRRGQSTELKSRVTPLEAIALFLYIPNWFVCFHLLVGRRVSQRHWRALRSLMGMRTKGI